MTEEYAERLERITRDIASKTLRPDDFVWMHSILTTGERVRHVRAGTEYLVITRSAMIQQSHLLQLEDEGPAAIYVGHGGKFYVRHPEDMDDGRFVPVLAL